MIEIRSTSGLIWSAGTVDTRPVKAANLSMELNRAGQLGLTLPASHPAAGEIRKLKTECWVLDDGEEIFRGRALESDRDLWGDPEIVFEGLRNVLGDELLRPVAYVGTAAGFLAICAQTYNDARPGETPFSVGIVDDFGEVKIDADDYPKILDVIDEKLIGVYGGFLRVYRADGANVIEYKKRSGGLGGQTIRFGVNLIDLTEHAAAGDVFSAILPLGKDRGEGRGRVTVESVNGGKDTIENAAAVSAFGRIVRKLTFDEIETPAELMAAAAGSVYTGITSGLTLRAADLRNAGVSVDRLRLGFYHHVVVPHLGIDGQIPLTKIERDLLEPAEGSYTFDAVGETLTGGQASASRSARGAYTAAGNAESKASRAEAAAAAARGDVAQIVDYAMETGSGSGWEWRKWKSGEVELFASGLSVSLSGWAAYGTGGLKIGSGTVTFPLQLTAAPQVWITLREAIVAAVSTTAGGASVSVVAPAELVNITADVYVRGTMT